MNNSKTLESFIEMVGYIYTDVLSNQLSKANHYGVYRETRIYQPTSVSHDQYMVLGRPKIGGPAKFTRFIADEYVKYLTMTQYNHGT